MTPFAVRFNEVVARKTAEAKAAVLRPFRTELDVASPGLIAFGNRWTRDLFDGPFYASPARRDQLPSTSLVFVQSADGNTGARNPTSLGGGDTDKHLIYEGLSRVDADAVLAGAETVRGTNLVLSVWHPELVQLRASFGLPRHPVQIVATLRGLDLSHPLMFNVPELRVAIVTLASSVDVMRRALVERPWITPVVMSGSEDLPTAFRALKDMGVRRISAIGGRTIARALVDAELIEDIYLTTSPSPGGEPNTRLSPRRLPTSAVVRKRELHAGVVFEHLTL